MELFNNKVTFRVEAEEEARHKQEDGFWDFLNSQEVGRIEKQPPEEFRLLVLSF